MVRLAFVLIALGLTNTVQAEPYQCMQFGLTGLERPSKPSCITISFGGDESLFQLCKGEMDSYQSHMREYLDCLQAEADEAVSDYNNAVQSFNCNARGDYC